MLVDPMEQLARLLLINPASSAEAERGSSRLRSLKTYMRSSITHEHFNHSAGLHAHQPKLDTLDFDEIVSLS
jgi:hypothetical protein